MKLLTCFPENVGRTFKSGSETTLKFGEDLFWFLFLFFILVFRNNSAKNCLQLGFGRTSEFMPASWDLAGNNCGPRSRGGVENTMLEAKAKDTKKFEVKTKTSSFENRPYRGQGQECLRPKTKNTTRK